MKKDILQALKVARKEGTNDLIFEKLEIIRDNELATFYKEIQCDRIDIQERFINNKIYDFIIDDEYLINGKSQDQKNAVAFGTRKGELLEIIFGAFIICGIADNEGKETDLQQSDIENILHAIGYLFAPNGEQYQAIKYTFEKE